MASTPLQQLGDHGLSVWIDYVSRPFIHQGGLQDYVDRGVVGVTSNPTIFQGAIADGDAYDDQIRELVDGGTTDAAEIFWQLASDDIRDACDVLKPVWEKTDGKDGWVSLEVDPRLAYDEKKTASEAQRLHELVGRPNLMIKIPATVKGLEAIEETVAAEIPVNVTLIFSLERHKLVTEAYVRGLQRLVEGGGDPSKVASVASFFVSRVDTEADKRLDAAGGHDELKGTLAVANARLAYQVYLDAFSGDAWEALAAKGATPQRCLWASTSMKDKSKKDTLYVEELVGPDQVNTMPRETAEAFEDHGEIRGDTITDDVDGARATLKAFEDAGVPYDEVVETLEKEGVEKFEASFAQLIDDVDAKREQLVTA